MKDHKTDSPVLPVARTAHRAYPIHNGRYISAYSCTRSFVKKLIKYYVYSYCYNSLSYTIKYLTIQVENIEACPKYRIS